MNTQTFYPGQLVIWRKPQWHGNRSTYIPGMFMGRNPHFPSKKMMVRVLYIQDHRLYVITKPQIDESNLLSLLDYYRSKAARRVEA